MGKTVEQSLLEVMEEEELANLRAQQVYAISKFAGHFRIYRGVDLPNIGTNEREVTVFCCLLSSVSLRRTEMLSWWRLRGCRNRRGGDDKKRFVSLAKL